MKQISFSFFLLKLHLATWACSFFFPSTSNDQKIESNPQKGKKEKKNLQTNNELFLLVNVEIVELLELFVENSNEPFLEVHQGPVHMVTMDVIDIGGAFKEAKVVGWRKRVGGGGDGFEKLFQGLVAEKLVPPLRQGLLQVDPELLAEFHRGDRGRQQLWRGGKEEAQGEGFRERKWLESGELGEEEFRNL